MEAVRSLHLASDNSPSGPNTLQRVESSSMPLQERPGSEDICFINLNDPI